MNDCEVVDNVVFGNKFQYCRTHKVESKDCPGKSIGLQAGYAIEQLAEEEMPKIYYSTDPRKPHWADVVAAPQPQLKTTPRPAYQPRYNVGEYVKVTEDNVCSANVLKGDSGLIVSDNGHGMYTVRMLPSRREYLITEKYLEPA